MKSSSAALKTMLKQSVSVKAVPKLYAEWEHNRHGLISGITVSPAQSGDEDWASIYDLDSIGLPNRPGTGAAKARLNTGLKANVGYIDANKAARFYLSSPVDLYRYFSSTQKSSSSTSGNGYNFSTPVVLTLTYASTVKANKIVVGFDTSYAKPHVFTVETSTNGTTWVQAASSPTINSKGLVELWRGSEGTWSSTKSYGNDTSLKAVRITVNAMNLPSMHLDVIQLGLRLEDDLTEVLEDYTKSMEVNDRSFIAPFGKTTSNTGSVTLDNSDRRFNGLDPQSRYYGLIGKKVKFTVDLSYDCTPYGGSNDERIRALTMWADDWEGPEDSTTRVTLKDSSVFLQEIDVPEVYWEDLSIGAIVWQLMDIAGFTNYTYSRSIEDSGQRVRYFWPKEEGTIWDQFSELCEGTQTAIYFDEYDDLQIKTRNAIFGPTGTSSWDFNTRTNGTDLADVAEIDVAGEDIVNDVDVNYQLAKYSDFNKGLPKMEVVWEPEEETVVLRSTPLAKDFLSNHNYLWINAKDAAFWPYESLVNIRGEIIKYRGKEYSWWKPGVGAVKEFIYSLEDKKRLDDDSNPNLQYSNAFTGRLQIDERGVWGSGTASHTIKEDAYTGSMTDLKANKYNYMSAVRKNGALQVSTRPGSPQGSYFLLKHNSAITPSTRGTVLTAFFGARIKFTNVGPNAAGIWFDGNGIDAGYYLELQTTISAGAHDKRVTKQEISLTSVINSGAGPKVVASDSDPKGIRAAISRNKWYTLEAKFEKQNAGTFERVTVFLDGIRMGTFEVPSGSRPVPQEHRFGLFARWSTVAEFEYLYGFGNPPSNDPDTSTFRDLVNGGFTSGYAERDWKYKSFVTRPVWNGKTYPQAISRAFSAIDEFGAIVHEVREFDVRFDSSNVPVQHSYVYLTNTSQVAILDYYSTPFGAKFLLANAARTNAVVKGSDTSTFGIDNSVEHNLFVYGRSLYQEDSQKINKQDKDSIRRNGKVSLTFENRLLQTEEAARELSDWIVRLWGSGADEVSVEIFGNALLQLGDIVTLTDPQREMVQGTHRYYVVGIDEGFSEGLNTRLTLRRAKSVTLS